jgi:SAM-dependent methyltransferase
MYGTAGSFEVVACPACGTGVTLPVVAEEELGAFYPDAYNAYGLPGGRMARLAATLLYRARYALRLRRPPLAALDGRPPGRLLDVGGGRGDLGVVLAGHGWSVTALDPSDGACAEARSRGVDAVCGTLLDRPAGLGEGYDAIAFQHSLEHVTDVAGNLRIAHDLLAPGGLLLVSVPNFAGWQRRRFGADWFHLDVPRHRTHFTPAGLRAALERAGFTPSTISTSTSADGLPMSLYYRIFGAAPATARRRYAAAAASVLSAPLTAALNALAGSGDALDAVAVRR